MKKFIIISLISALTLPIFACGWGGTDNYYLFSAYINKDFKTRVQEISENNWKAYMGSTEKYFWFNADEVIKAARQKGDALMVSYVQNLQKYLDCVDVEQRKQYEWDYPSKEDIDAQKRNLQSVRTYAFSKVKTKLRSQHALLFMRCNMMLGRHQENITFWEQTASQFIETVYKDMMKNIYAGALYKTGQEDKAGELFAEMDDYQSLMTQYYKKRSYLAISQHYKRNPNSKVLPFLLTDFVNNTQEAHDHDVGGKLFIRDISDQEAWQMIQFCELVIREGKTEVPIMWKSAKAWLEYMTGKQKEATKDIEEATNLEGTERMKDNARVLKLYITAAQAKQGKDFDNYLAEELTWLTAHNEEDGFWRKVQIRLADKVLIDHYRHTPERAIAITKALKTGEWLYDIDTLRVDRLEKYLYYTNLPAKNALDKFLKSSYHENDTTISELIGTKYMRLAQWDKAIMWLEKIPVSYYNNNMSNEYLCYSVRRSVEVEPWIKRQWINDSELYSSQLKWWKPLKLDFCREIQMMESSLNLLKGKALEQQYYNLAVRYAQINVKGDCWWMLRTTKSVYDSIRVNEVDYSIKAQEMLQKAAMSSDVALKRKALFAMGWRELYFDNNYWRENLWDSNVGDYVTKYNTSSPQYRAFQGLYDQVGYQPKEDYIRKCDEYDQFRFYYRKLKH